MDRLVDLKVIRFLSFSLETFELGLVEVEVGVEVEVEVEEEVEEDVDIAAAAWGALSILWLDQNRDSICFPYFLLESWISIPLLF